MTIPQKHEFIFVIVCGDLLSSVIIKWCSTLLAHLSTLCPSYVHQQLLKKTSSETAWPNLIKHHRKLLWVTVYKNTLRCHDWPTTTERSTSCFALKNISSETNESNSMTMRLEITSAQPSDWSIHLQDSILIGQDSGQLVDYTIWWTFHTENLKLHKKIVPLCQNRSMRPSEFQTKY